MIEELHEVENCSEQSQDSDPGDCILIPDDKPPVKLIGTNGNSLSIVGHCRSAGKKAGWNDQQLSAFVEEALSGNRDKVLQTAMKYFTVS